MDPEHDSRAEASNGDGRGLVPAARESLVIGAGPGADYRLLAVSVPPEPLLAVLVFELLQ